MTADAKRWFLIPSPVDSPRLRLFCFPHAGGSATIFHKWPTALPADVELRALCYPGRGSRMREPAYTELGALVSELVAVLEPLLDTPWVAFGHSLGALVAFELARELRRRQLPQPRRLIVSARGAPGFPRRPAIHRLPKERFLAELQSRYGEADVALSHPELVELLLPILRADMQLLETWTSPAEAPLALPIDAFTAAEDPSVAPEAVAGWQEKTTGGFRHEVLPGKHFYLMKDPGVLLQKLRQILDDTV